MVPRVSACLLAISLLLSSVLAAVCPDNCVCSTTRDGLHRATCSNLGELYKFTLRQKHHNINILDLSHNNITKLSHELDRLTEIVTLDLSTNGITELNKFLYNAKKLVHLNLANNRIERLSLVYLPTSISSLDLTNNLLQDVPSNVGHLDALEHLELEGNPLHCSCDNIRARDRLLANHVFIDAAKCASPEKVKNRSWLELKTKDICKVTKSELNMMDMMMGDEPIDDAVKIGEETTALKSMPSDLDDSKIIHEQNTPDDDDSVQYMRVGRQTTSSPLSDFEGSGEVESTTVSDVMEARQADDLNAKAIETDEVIPVDKIVHSEDLMESSGDGSGFGIIDYDDETTPIPDVFTTPIPDHYPGRVKPLITDDETDEYPTPGVPTVFQGGPDWQSKENPPADPITTAAPEKSIAPVTGEPTESGKLRITQAPEINGQPSEEEKPTTHKTGTYVCIAIIVILLVGLIGFAIIKGQMRKRRDRRLLRQQKRDVEKASKEMVDMNKSLLGKPALLDPPMEKKVNGKYELVPTHENHQRKSVNGDITNGIKHNDNNGIRTDSPRDTNQNKSSSKDNNLNDDNHVPLQETSFESDPASPDSRKDTHSLSSEDIFVPLNDDPPRLNGTIDSDASQLLNGDQNTESDFLSPSREYVPVYSPDMGRVRIKLTETPKPKTPVLVTRSRSNAGDIIITPAMDGNSRKSTT